jgi:hypothetical protein
LAQILALFSGSGIETVVNKILLTQELSLFGLFGSEIDAHILC